MLKKIYKKLRYNLFSPVPGTMKTDHKIKALVRKVRYNLFGRIPFLGRKASYGESFKARARRQREGFFDKYCKGNGLDIGYGGDPVAPGVTGWDYEHGDAQYLKGLDDEAFDFVYSSHLLEHLPDVETALTNWWRVLKPGGYLQLYLPHRDLYEKKKTLPSRFNYDHEHFFLPDHDDLPDTIGIAPLVKRLFEDGDIIYCKTCDEGYVNPGDELPSEGEFSIELVAHKQKS